MKKVKKECKLKRDGFTCCSVGGKNHKNFVNTVFVLELNFFTEESVEAGFLTGWHLYDANGLFKSGETVEDFIYTLQNLVDFYKLEVYNNFSKDSILIYVDNVEKIYGFFLKYVTAEFMPHSCEICRFFEFRNYKTWQKDIVYAKEAARIMQKFVDEFFVPEKYFYLTPNQRTRKLLSKACKEEKSTVAKDAFPENPFAYNVLRSALFGGICYCPLPGVIKEKPILGLDIKSAYIYSLLTKKFPVSKAKEENPENWEFYVKNEFEGSLGTYKITYTTASTIVHCFKDLNGKNLVSGQNVTVTLTLTNIDLDILLNLEKVYIKEVVCTYLEVYDLDYLPRYVVARLVEEYLKKSHIDKEKNPELYKLQKTILNGIYGNCIKKIDFAYFGSKKNGAYLTPQWGIWTTSYTKQHLLGLALQMSGWLYSDTDSIYCYDTIQNRNLLKAYNEKTRKIMASFCERTGYIHPELLELGEFELEHEIVKFKALKQKEYLFTTKEGKIIVKAAGCSKEEMPLVDSLYKLKSLPVGTKIFSFIKDKPSKVEKDGKIYENESSYYELAFKGEKAKMMLTLLAKMEEGELDA